MGFRSCLKSFWRGVSDKITFLRVIEWVAAWAAAILIHSFHDGQCITYRTNRKSGKEYCYEYENDTLAPANWLGHGENDYPELRGQIFVATVTLLCGFISLALIFTTGKVRYKGCCNRSQRNEPAATTTMGMQRVPEEKGPEAAPLAGEVHRENSRLLAQRHPKLVKAILPVCFLVALIAAIMETWYAFGFGRVSPLIYEWAGGAALCYLVATAYAIDYVLLRRDQANSY